MAFLCFEALYHAHVKPNVINGSSGLYSEKKWWEKSKTGSGLSTFHANLMFHEKVDLETLEALKTGLFRLHLPAPGQLHRNWVEIH